MATEPTIADGLLLAQERAAGYRFLAWLLLDNPDSEFVTQLLSTDTTPSASLPLAAHPQFLAGLEEMRFALSGHSSGTIEDRCRELAVQRARLFRGVAAGYGPPPPYEGLYRRGEGVSEPELLLELLGLYRELGVGLLPGREERPDYLGLELDVMRLMCEEEGRLSEAADAAGTVECRAFQRRFLQAHLLAWVPRYCETMLGECGAGFYRGVIHALSGFLAEEASLLDKPRSIAFDVAQPARKETDSLTES
jgi:putative dimethyl sulfoxide reductase chaperone